MEKIGITRQSKTCQGCLIFEYNPQRSISLLHGFLNCFAASARYKHYEYCSRNGYVKVKMLFRKEKLLKFHNGQNQFKVLFMLYAEFESILKPVDEQYREKMNQMKSYRRVKKPYTEKINTHVVSGWCVHSTFTYGDVLDLLKMYRGKAYVEKFVGHIKDELKWLHSTFYNNQ